MGEMKLQRPKRFFGLGFGVETSRLFYESKTMCYHWKIFLGWWVLTFNWETRAHKDYVLNLSGKNGKSDGVPYGEQPTTGEE